MRVVRCRSHHPGNFCSEHKRRLRPVLIQAPGEQCVRECRAGSVHVDNHAVAGRFVDIGHLDTVWPIEPSHLYRAHIASVIRAEIFRPAVH